MFQTLNGRVVLSSNLGNNLITLADGRFVDHTQNNAVHPARFGGGVDGRVSHGLQNRHTAIRHLGLCRFECNAHIVQVPAAADSQFAERTMRLQLVNCRVKPGRTGISLKLVGQPAMTDHLFNGCHHLETD